MLEWQNRIRPKGLVLDVLYNIYISSISKRVLIRHVQYTRILYVMTLYSR